MAKSKRDDFTTITVRKLAERAGYFCSNPYCKKFTVGPNENDDENSTKIGIAAHICAAAEGGPRYDASQTPSERKSIQNGIWLCGNCSILIDKNNGDDYPVEWLKEWKKQHEKMIKKFVESGFSPLSGDFLKENSSEKQIVQDLFINLEDKRVLYAPAEIEHFPYVIESLLDLRKQLNKTRSKVEKSSKLDKRIKTMLSACRQFMTENQPEANLAPAEFNFSLGVLRKAFGIHLSQIENEYNVQVDGDLRLYFPTS